MMSEEALNNLMAAFTGACVVNIIYGIIIFTVWRKRNED